MVGGVVGEGYLNSFMLLVIGVLDRCVCIVDLVVVIFVLCVCGRCCIIMWLVLVKN